MSETLDASWDEPVAPKRPVFLTVLCILTFVSCGITLLTSIYGIAVSSNTDELFKMAGSMPQSGNKMFDGIANVAAEYSKWTTISYYLAFGNCVLCFAGSLLMWKLRKPGFFIYTFGQILPFISLFGLYTVVKDVPFLGVVTILSGIFGALFSIAFVIMYGVNLKHMR